jgi:hypothetical protein
MHKLLDRLADLVGAWPFPKAPRRLAVGFPGVDPPGLRGGLPILVLAVLLLRPFGWRYEARAALAADYRLRRDSPAYSRLTTGGPTACGVRWALSTVAWEPGFNWLP